MIKTTLIIGVILQEISTKDFFKNTKTAVPPVITILRLFSILDIFVHNGTTSSITLLRKNYSNTLKMVTYSYAV